MTDAIFLKEIGIDFNPTDYYGTVDTKLLVATLRTRIKELCSELESASKKFSKNDEEGITSIIAIGVNRTLQFTATVEENNRGHVDLTVTSPNFSSKSDFKYMGEAKIWKGKQYCIDGFDQLNRYITGRNYNSCMLLYFKGKKCDELFVEYASDLIKIKGGEEINKESRLITTKHIHSSTAEIEVDHFASHIPE